MKGQINIPRRFSRKKSKVVLCRWSWHWLARDSREVSAPYEQGFSKEANSRNPSGHLRSCSLDSGTSAGSCVPERSQSPNCVVYSISSASDMLQMFTDNSHMQWYMFRSKVCFLITCPREFGVALLKQRRLSALGINTSLAWLSCSYRLCENVDVKARDHVVKKEGGE